MQWSFHITHMLIIFFIPQMFHLGVNCMVLYAKKNFKLILYIEDKLAVLNMSFFEFKCLSTFFLLIISHYNNPGVQ